MLFSVNTFAGEITGLFNVELGKPFPIKARISDSSESRMLFIFFRAPVPDNYEINNFHDFEVRISKKSNNVIYISAERAYKSPEECMKQLKIIGKYLETKYGKPTSFNKWENPVSKREAWANCVTRHKAPYDELTIILYDRNES